MTIIMEDFWMNEIPRPGERYRHFKNREYQIIAVAEHSETGEKMVVYQALYGDFGVWVRPLSMFMEKVDREKYPEAEQEYRFERIAAGPGEAKEIFEEPGGSQRERDFSENGGVPAEETPMHPLLLSFLDAETAEEQLEILHRMKGKVGRREVESLCFCMDVSPIEGTAEEQLENLIQFLRMQQRYDAPRLRRS